MANFTDPVKSENTRYIVSSATPDIYTDIHNNVYISALATNITSMTTNLTGVPVDFQSLTIRIKDNGVARTITWGSKFESRGKTLPTTTVAGKILSVYLEYNIASLKWGCVGVAIESLEGVTLDSLDDVTITAPVNGQQLVYNAGAWANGTPAGGGDMLASVYDTDADGVVDTSNDVSDTPTTTNTSVASQGGLNISIDAAIGTLTTATTGITNPVEDAKFGVFIRSTGTNVGTSSGQFVTGAGGTGLRVFRYGISGLTNVGSTFCRAACSPGASDGTVSSENLTKFFIPVKPSTKYKVSYRLNVTSFTAVGTGPGISLTCDTYNQTTKVTTSAGFSTAYTASTGGFVSGEFSFTTGATISHICWILYMTSGNGSVDLDINSMKIEEVVEPVANSLTSTSPSLVSFTAVGNTDNTDQSQTTDNGGSAVGNSGGLQYMLSQSFVPTKSKLTGVYLYKRASTGTPTGNLTVEIRTNNAGDPSSTVIATNTVTLATYNAIADNSEFFVSTPAIVTPGTTYHIVVKNTATESAGNYFNIGNNSAGGYSSGDQRYSTDGGTVWAVNGTADLRFRTTYYKPTTGFKASQNNKNISLRSDEDGFIQGSIVNVKKGEYEAFSNFGTNQSGYLGIYQYLLSTNLLFGTTTNMRFDLANEYVTLKFQAPIGYTFGDIAYTTKTVSGGSAGRLQYIDYSFDNATWVNLSTISTASTTVETTFFIPGGSRTVYVRYLNGAANANNLYYYKFVSAIPNLTRLYNYPTNKDIIQSYTMTTGSAVTSATYRATKFGFPAIEYSNGEYQFLELDTTASGSTVAFSANGSSYTTVADGASIVLTSTVIPVVWVKANITANRLYLSSNDYNASSSQDGSLKQTVVYQVKNMGLKYDVQALQSEFNSLKVVQPLGIQTTTGDITEEANSYIIVPTATGNINLYKIPKAGTRFSIIVKTSGTSSYTMTFNTGFKSQGTLDTGTVDSKYFTVNFISDGTQAIETSRTTAM